MILEIIIWLYSIYTIIFSIYVVVWNISRMLRFTKNNRKEKYENFESYIKYYHNKYIAVDTDVPTEEELEKDIQILSDIIEKLKNEINILYMYKTTK